MYENKAWADLKQTTKEMDKLSEAEACRVEVAAQLASGMLCEDTTRQYQSQDGRIVRDMFKVSSHALLL
jgi:hypothetical protein